MIQESSRPRVLVTGFNGFDGRAQNPSQLVVEALQAGDSDACLITEVLRTEFVAAGRRVRELIAQHRPAVCICVGLNERAETIHLEQIAVNIMDARIPDNAGNQPKGLPINAEGPASYRSTLPLERIGAELAKQDIPHHFSESAGRFVCNHVFYSAADEIRRLGLSTICGFVHVPWATELGPLDSTIVAMPMETILTAVRTCIAVSLNQCV